VVGLFYYFGYVRRQALFGYFGIDANLLDFGPQDYLVRSAGVAFKPIGIVLLAALAGYAGWMLAEQALSGREPATTRVTAIAVGDRDAGHADGDCGGGQDGDRHQASDAAAVAPAAGEGHLGEGDQGRPGEGSPSVRCRMPV
jgi:hypothetical protein